VRESSQGSVRVTVNARIANCKVRLEFDSPAVDLRERVKKALDELIPLGLEVLPTERVPSRNERDDTSSPGGLRPSDDDETPVNRIARDADLESESVRKHLGCKDDSLQLYRPSRLQILDALCILCYAFEKGLSTQFMEYDRFVQLVEGSQIKMKTPMSTQVQNLIRLGYVDKRPYEASRRITLTPQGEKKGREALKGLVSGENRDRREFPTKKKTKKRLGRAAK